MATEVGLNGPYQIVKGGLTTRTTFASAMSGHAKCHILVVATQSPRLTMIVIAAGHNSAMDLPNQIPINRSVYGYAANPAIGSSGSACLALRSGHQLLGCLVTHQRDPQLVSRSMFQECYLESCRDGQQYSHTAPRARGVTLFGEGQADCGHAASRGEPDDGKAPPDGYAKRAK